MRKKNIHKSELHDIEIKEDGNEAIDHNFYKETFESKYEDFKGTFVSIWNKVTNSFTDPSLDAGHKAGAAILSLTEGGLSTFSTLTSFAGNLSEGMMLPFLRAINFTKGTACLPVGKQLDPVLNLIDIHMVLMPPSPAPVPMTHPFMGLSFRAKDFMAIAAMRISVHAGEALVDVAKGHVDSGDLSDVDGEMIADGINTTNSIARIFIGNLGASVTLGYVLPRTVAGTPIRCFQHAPAGGGFHPVAEKVIMKNKGHAFVGSMFVVADGMPLVGVGHLQNACSDVGIPSIHDKTPEPESPEEKAKAKLYSPTGLLIPVPFTKFVLTNPMPSPINPLEVPKMLMTAGLNKLKKSRARKVARNVEAGKPCSSFSKALNKVNKKLFKHKYTKGLYNKIDKSLKTYVGHPIDVAGGDLFTDSRDFSFAGVIPLSFQRVWYSDSDYNGPLGYGWHHSYDWALFVKSEFRRAQVRLGDGRFIDFDRIPTREFPTPRYHRSEKMWLCYHPEGYYYIKDQKSECYLFNTPLFANQDGAYLLSSIENSTGFSIRFSYNHRGVLTQIVDSVHRVYEVESDASDRLVKVWTEAPEVGQPKVCLAEYVYSKAGDMIVHLDEMRQPLYMQYDNHLLMRETWRNGHNWHFRYEGKQTGSRCVESWGDGNIQQVILTYYQGETHVLDGEGNKTIYKHHNGLVYETVDANGGLWGKYYNKYGELERSTDPLGHEKTQIHDDYGNLKQVIEADGQLTQFFYLDLDNPFSPTEVIDSRGGKWRYKYLIDGRLREKTNPLGAKITYRYNEQRLLSSIVDGLGASTTLEYDKHYNVIRVSGLGENRMQYQYDLWNRCTHRINASGLQQKRVLDYLGRALVVCDFDGNTIHLKYDALDNVIAYEDNNRQLSFRYKGIHKLISKSEGGQVVRYSYDSNERLRCITNEEGQQYHFVLDGVGQIVEERGFDGVVKKYKRNKAGWITSIHRADQQWTHYSHDEMGRVIQVDYSDKTSETYAYEYGAMVRAENEAGVVAFAYDKEGQVIEESFNGEKVQSTYDVYGRRTVLNSSLGAHFVYQFDALHNVVESRFNDWKVDHTYDALGWEKTRNFEGGVQQLWSYDSLGRMQSQGINKISSDRPAVPQFFRHYTWTTGGLLHQTTDQSQKQTRYQRDQRGYLQSVIYPGGEVEERGVDASGNLYQRLNCKDRTYKKNRLTETEKARYTYDKEGFLIEKEEKGSGKKWGYSWNGAGMLSQVKRPDGYTVDFQYDALGRRVSKKYKHTTTHYLWQGDVVLHEYKRFDARETTADDMITWVFEQGSYSPMAKIKGDKKYSLVVDHLGTPIRAYTASGDKVWERELDSCGNARMTVGEEGFCTYLYPGQTYDKETGLAYNRFRYYDPEVGNYIAQDPIGLAGNNPTLYGYVADPTGWLDVFGLAGDSYSISKRKAFREAKRDASIPMAEQPYKVDKVPMSDKWGAHILDKYKQTIMTTEYYYVNNRLEHIVVQNHAAGHQYPDGIGNQGPHFNVRPINNTRTGKVKNTKEHYPFDK